MSLRSPAVWIVFLFVTVFAVPGHAADFVDSAERYVVLPDRIGRVMAADQSAAVLVFVLAPEKLVGWSRPLTREQRAYLPAKFAQLPVAGQLIGPTPTVAADAVARLRPDLIIETGVVSAEAAARADAIQRQTRVPYILLDGGIQQIPDTLATVGAMLGVAERGQDLAHSARGQIDDLRGKLLITESTERPLVYYGRGADGLETGLARSQVMAAIDQAGVINVAARLGTGELTRVTHEQIFQCAAARSNLAWFGRSHQQTRLPGPGRALRVDRRPDRGQPDHRTALVERVVLSRGLSDGSARDRARLLR